MLACYLTLALALPIVDLRLREAPVAHEKAAQLCDDVEQFRGYFSLRTSSPGSKNLFYWSFAARQSPETAPVVLWLTGGPGCSSEIALFGENGPCKVNAEGTGTVKNPFSWNDNAHLLYVDQPVRALLSPQQLTPIGDCLDRASHRLWACAGLAPLYAPPLTTHYSCPPSLCVNVQVGTGFSYGSGYDHDEKGVADDMYAFFHLIFLLLSSEATCLSVCLSSPYLRCWVSCAFHTHSRVAPPTEQMSREATTLSCLRRWRVCRRGTIS
jgi:hypothetical protein